MNDSSSTIKQARELLIQRRAATAETLLCQALDRSPDDGQLRLLLARARHQLGDFRAAAAAFEHAATLVPLGALDQCSLAECYGQIGLAQQGIDLLVMLFDSDRCPTDLLPRLATLFGRLGELPRALEICRMAAERLPAQAEAHFAVAFYSRKLGYPAGVVLPSLRRAFELAPHHPVYRLNLAFLLAEEGRADEAYDLLRELPPAACVCSCQLRRMMRLFQTLGDHDRWSACALELKRLRGKL